MPEDKEKKETMQEAYERVFNYHPTDEEVDEKYSEEFKKFCDNL